MKLSEVIAILEENPDKVFEGNKYEMPAMTVRTMHNCLIFEDKDGRKQPAVDLERDWQEVKQPVPWQEAIQAWMGGSSISCEIDDNIGKIRFKFTDDLYLTNSRSTPISIEMLQCGKWYID